MNLSNRIVRLEQAGEQLAHRRRVAEWRDAGLDDKLAELAARAEELAPPAHVPGGTDLEPTVRRLAELLDADAEALVEDMRREMGDQRILAVGRPGLVEVAE